jgi:integrase
MTKNGERRELPINQTLRDALKIIPRRIDSPYVFIGREGKRFVDIRAGFKSALRRAGIKDFRFHDLRSYFCKPPCYGKSGYYYSQNTIGS